VTAIGDPASLPTRFAQGPGGTYVSTLKGSFGIRVETRTNESVTLPGLAGIQTRVAHPPAGSASRPPSQPLRPLRHRPPQHRPQRPQRPQMIPALGLLLGVIIGLALQPTVPLWLQPYLPIAVIAALDAVFGGVRAVLDGIFNDKVFVVSFLSNVLVAALIVFLGDKLGVGSQLSTGVVVVLGVRIFSNVASIRRHLFNA
jgi:small basic protein